MVGTKGVQQLTPHQRIWLEWIQSCEAAGMTMSAYAAEHDLDARTMYGARKALKRKGVLPGGNQPVRFQRARIASADGRDMSWRIELPNGLAVSLSGSADAGSLSAVLKTAADLG